MREIVTKEFTIDHGSCEGMYYYIRVMRGSENVERIEEPTMKGAFEKLKAAGYKTIGPDRF